MVYVSRNQNILTLSEILYLSGQLQFINTTHLQINKQNSSLDKMYMKKCVVFKGFRNNKETCKKTWKQYTKETVIWTLVEDKEQEVLKEELLLP